MGFHDGKDGIPKARFLWRKAALLSSTLQFTVLFDPPVCPKSYLAVSN